MAQVIFDQPITLGSTANLFITVGAQQSYTSTSGSIPWDLYLIWNGQAVNHTGGASAYSDSISLFGVVLGWPAGQYNVRVEWEGATQVTLVSPVVSVQVQYK